MARFYLISGKSPTHKVPTEAKYTFFLSKNQVIRWMNQTLELLTQITISWNANGFALINAAKCAISALWPNQRRFVINNSHGVFHILFLLSFVLSYSHTQTHFLAFFFCKFTSGLSTRQAKRLVMNTSIRFLKHFYVVLTRSSRLLRRNNLSICPSNRKWSGNLAKFRVEENAKMWKFSTKLCWLLRHFSSTFSARIANLNA